LCKTFDQGSLDFLGGGGVVGFQFLVPSTFVA